MRSLALKGKLLLRFNLNYRSKLFFSLFRILHSACICCFEVHLNFYEWILDILTLLIWQLKHLFFTESYVQIKSIFSRFLFFRKEVRKRPLIIVNPGDPKSWRSVQILTKSWVIKIQKSITSEHLTYLRWK